MKLTAKVFLVLIFTMVSTLFVFAAGETESQTIKIGVAGPHSGDLASYGLPTINAAELVVAKWNANGGIDGKMIELVIEDDECKPETATDVASNLLGNEVTAVIGHICSGATKSALSIYTDAQTIVISPSATNPPLTQSGDYPTFFRTIAPDDAQAQLDVDFILNTLRLTKIAILHDKGDYGKGFAEFVQLYFEEDGTADVVLFDGITAGEADYSAIINQIEQSGAEVLVYGGYHPEASKLVTQIKDKGLDIVFVSDDGVKDATFVDVAKEYAEGVYASGPQDTSSNPLTIEANNAHVAEYGDEPGPFFINAYAAAEALFSAIEIASVGGEITSEAIKNALQNNYFETPLGSISFDSKGDAIGVGFSVYQVQNGVYVELK